MKAKTSEHNEFPCEAGCQVFYGGEIRHHKDCVYYPDSLSQLIDEQKSKIRELESLLKSGNVKHQTS